MSYATFWDKGTEVPSLSQDKETRGHAQNLTKGRDGSGQPFKIQNEMQDGTVQDFDSLSRAVPGDKTGQSRKVCSRIRKGPSKTEKGRS